MTVIKANLIPSFLFTTRIIIFSSIYAIEGFCNSKKNEFKKEFSIKSKEYFLEVTYIYADGSKKIAYKTLKI